MLFWWFLFISDLLCPVIMIAFGVVFLRSAPKKVNCIYGYRTSRSMKNRDTWEFAHKYCGKVWLITGLMLLPGCAVPMIFMSGKTENEMATVSLIISFVAVTVLVASLIPTELALKRTFDEDGNRYIKG